MPATTNYGFPYPGLGDAPNVPDDMQSLAEAVDTEIVRVDADVAAIVATEPPVAHLRQTVAQTIATATYTSATFTTEDLDSANGHSTSVNTSRYTVQQNGVYLLSGAGTFAVNASGNRSSQWAINGSGIAGGAGATFDPAVSSLVQARTIIRRLVVGDFVELQLRQTSGGNLLTSVTSEFQTTMTVAWISP